MKRTISLVVAVMMLVACFAFAGCGKKAASDTIKIGIIGPHTGATAMYGLAVKNGAQLYIDQVNEAGGVNGKKIETIVYDNKGDSAEAVTAFNRMVDEGITGLVGDVLTGNTIAVVGEAYPINMPMITASATADAVTYNSETQTVYSNVFRTCFIDSFQGQRAAQFAQAELQAATVATFYQIGDDYTEGLAKSFAATSEELGMTVAAQESYAAGDVDFKAQLTNILAANPDVLYIPNYYQDDALIVTQARDIGYTGTFLGGDGWGGIMDYATAEVLDGSYYFSGYSRGLTPEITEFDEAYNTAYGEYPSLMFSALAYDAAKLMVAAIEAAEATGEAPASDAYKQTMIDFVKNDGASVSGITSAGGYTFDEKNNPVKDIFVIAIKDGAESYLMSY